MAEGDLWFGWFPTFAHVLGFSLITAGLSGRVFASVVLWVTTNVGFEIFQGLWSKQASYASPWLDGYFVNGQFDPNDIAAAPLAGGVAYVVGLYLFRTGKN